MEPQELSSYRDVWVYVVHSEGSLTRPSLEALAAGRKVADKLKQRLVAVLLGDNIENLARKPLEHGVDEVIYCDDPRLGEYFSLPYTSTLTSLVRERKPNVFIFVADEVGRDLAPRLAYRLKTGLATDNIDLEVEDYYHAPSQSTYKNLLIQIRPDFATRVAKIYTPTRRPQIATIRPGNFPLPEKRLVSSGSVSRHNAEFGADDFKVLVKEMRELPSSKVDLENAQAVVSIGLGILRDSKGNPKSPIEGYNLAKELADAIRDRVHLRTEIGASRALIYAELKELDGLITRERQVGQTGRTVSPYLYVAIGISGAVQHRVGMLRSKNIVSINVDPNAPIHSIAHYPIVGDVYDEVPRLIEEIRRI